MRDFFCKNCFNFKDRTITKKHFPRVSKYKIFKALRQKDVSSFGLPFPFNLTVYKRVKKYGECRIFYCTKYLLKRDLYVDRGNVAEISCGKTPCSQYVPVHVKVE